MMVSDKPTKGNKMTVVERQKIENISMFSRMFCGKMIYVVTCNYWKHRDKFQQQFDTFDSATDFISEVSNERMHPDYVSILGTLN